MGIFADLIAEQNDRMASEGRASLENPSIPLSLASFLGWLGAGEPTAAGEIVNIQTALQIPAVFAGVRLVAEAIGSMPVNVLEARPDGTREKIDHDLTWLLNYEPNDEMSGPHFWETYVANLVLAGNAYAEILRDQAQRLRGFYPLSSGVTRPRRNENGVLEYVTTVGMPNGNERVISAADMLHCRLFSMDGLKGLSPVIMARQMLGLARAAEKFGARFFGNGAFPGGILTPAPEGRAVDPKQAADMKDSWERNYGGENARRIAIMLSSWKWQQIGISPEDSQFLGTQQFARTQVGGLFDVPPHKLGDTSRLSNKNHEQEELSFYADTVRPIANRIEKELTRKVMPRSGPKAYIQIVEFDVTARLRADFVTTQQGLALGRQWGWLTANDCRRTMGMSPGGPELDVYMTPVNMQNAELLLDTESTQDQPIDADPGDEDEKDDEKTGEVERKMLGRYAARHARGFVAAMMSFATRRDFDVLRLDLFSVVDRIAQDAAGNHPDPFAIWPGEVMRRLSLDAIEGVIRRLRRLPENFPVIESLCRNEFRRVVRAVHINAARERAALQAEKQLADQGEGHAA